MLLKAFHEGQLKPFLDQSLEVLALDIGDGTRCVDGRQQMRSLDEVRFGSKAEVAAGLLRVRLARDRTFAAR
jgi:hypothetical protein